MKERGVTSAATCVLNIAAVICQCIAVRAADSRVSTRICASRQLLVNPSFREPYEAFSANGGNISGEIAYQWNDNTEWAGPLMLLSYAKEMLSTDSCSSGSPSQRITIASTSEKHKFLQFAQYRQLRPGR